MEKETMQLVYCRQLSSMSSRKEFIVLFLLSALSGDFSRVFVVVRT